MKRLWSILLVFVMLLSFAACTGGKQPETDTTQTTAENQMTGETAETVDPESDDLPENLTFRTDKGPADFTVLTQDYHAAVTDFVIDESTTNAIEQETFRRNAYVEERLGVFFDIQTKPYDQVNETIQALVVSNTPVDLISARASWAFLILTDGVLGDWNELPYVNLKKPWWNQSSVNELSVNDKTYILQGDINPSFVSHTMCMYFNKNLVKSHLQDVNVFELVSDFEWNYNKFYSLIKDMWFSSDSVKDINDTYGFVAQAEHSLRTFQFSFNMKPTTKTMDGFPILDINTEKWTAVSNELYTLMYETDGVYMDKTWTDYREMFASGKAAFVSGMFAHALLGYYASMTDEYAIIPFPMYDESQETYLTGVDNACSSIYYMEGIANPAMVGAVCEALASYSYKQISPIIYEVALKYRYSTSEEQMEMVDFIHNGISFDFGYIYNAAPMLSTLIGSNASSNFVSYSKTNYKSWESKIGDFIDFYINGAM